MTGGARASEDARPKGGVRPFPNARAEAGEPGSPTWTLARRPAWRRLAELVAVFELGGRAPGPREVEDFTARYREVASDLLVARAGKAAPAVERYLNDLLGRCYLQLYGAHRTATLNPLGFWRHRFPALLRAQALWLALGLACFVAGFASGYARLSADPSRRYALLPVDHREVTPAERVRYDTRHVGANVRALDVAERSPGFSLMLTLHNARAAILAFGLGVFGGAPTALVLFANGASIGALAADYARAAAEPANARLQIGAYFWAWILPHGVLELAAILVAAAGGFALGRAVVAPGRFSTREALARAAPTATLLLMGAAPMFLVAGVIEATISQLHPPVFPYALKLGVAAMVALVLALYVIGMGVDREAEVAAERGLEPWYRVGAGGALEILTPEHVVYRYALAGWTRRAVAQLADLVLVATIAGALGIAAMPILWPIFPDRHGSEVALVGMALAAPFALVGYFYVADRSERASPGKRAFDLAVMDERGRALTPAQRALRNLVRAIDLLPGAYLVGAASAALSTARQRLGDRVAGTLVIERGRAELPPLVALEQTYRPAAADRPRLLDRARTLGFADRDLAIQLALRMGSLSLEARLRLAGDASDELGRRAGWPRPAGQPTERHVGELAWAALALAQESEEDAPADHDGDEATP